MLEQLEGQSGALGVTHYAVTMPTLEEVFLRCTAESHQQDASFSTDKSDGRCTITLTPQAKQPAAVSANGASETTGSSEQAGSSSTHAASSSGTAGGADGSREQGGSGGSHGASTTGEDLGSGGSCNAGGSSSPASSDGGDGDGVQAGREGGPLAAPLPISRDDSAEALSSALAPPAEEPHRDQGRGKTPDINGQDASTSRQHSQDTPLTEVRSTVATAECNGANGLHAAAGDCAEDELEDVPLHEHAPKPRSRAKQWCIAFREMLRKRAIIAGDSPFVMLL